MPLDLTALTAEVERDNEVNSSAALLIAGLATELEATKGDPAKVDELVARLRSNSDALASAVAANTPAEAPVEPTDPGTTV